MKKIKYILLILILVLVSGCKKTDSILFKNEYESLNGNSNYRAINIPSDNPFVYITDLSLVEKIENKEDMVVYFGFNKCPWCRSILNNLIDVSSDLEISKIYYLDIYDLRDKKTIVDSKIKVENEGTTGYNKLLELLNDYLADYVIDNQVVGKRIYAPNILVIKDNIIYPVETGISDLQTDSKMELTKEINEDSYNKIHELLEKYTNSVCNSTGC